MRCTILAISLAIVCASASPVTDTVVPEESLYAADDDLSEARDTVSSMTAAGRSDKDCRKLVSETRKEVQTNVATCNKLMKSLPNGGQCLDLGHSVVKAAEKAKSSADKHVITTSAALTKAASAKVTFGSRTLSSLTEGRCDTFFSSTAYTSAKATRSAAVTAHTKAKGAAEQAAKDLTIATAAAKKAKNGCLCKTKADHEGAFNKNSASNAANRKAWDFACKVECVLDGKTNCKCSAAPKCARAALHGEVGKAVCKTAQKVAQKVKADPCGSKMKTGPVYKDKKGKPWQVCYVDKTSPSSSRTGQCKSLLPSSATGRTFACWHYRNCKGGNCKDMHCDRTSTQHTTRYNAWGGSSHILAVCIKK